MGCSEKGWGVYGVVIFWGIFFTHTHTLSLSQMLGIIFSRKEEQNDEVSEPLRKKVTRREISTEWFESSWFAPSRFLPIDCLANHPHISYLQVYLVCCGICGVVALFFAAHNNLYAEILIDTRIGKIDDGSFVITKQAVVLGMSFAESVCTFWKAGVYILTFGTVIGTGLLPYTKAFMMAFCFFAPRNILSVKSRKTILRKLDHLNKFTLSINVAMALLSVVCAADINNFSQVYRELGIDLATSPGLLEMSVFVKVSAGFYLSLAGCVLSQCVGIAILFLHRMNEELVPLREEASNWERVAPSLSSLAFRNSDVSFERSDCKASFGVGSTMGHASSFMNREDNEKGGRILQVSTICAIVFAFVIVSRCSLEESFSKSVGGVAALALPSAERQENYTYIGFFQDFVDSSPDLSTFGTQFTRIVLMLACFVFPLLHLIVLLMLYVVRLRTYEQWQLYYATELISGASCLHVVLGVIGALVLELGPLIKSSSDDVTVPGAAREIVDSYGGLLSISIIVNAWFVSLCFGGLLIQGTSAVVLSGGEELVMERTRMEHYRKASVASTAKLSLDLSDRSFSFIRIEDS